MMKMSLVTLPFPLLGFRPVALMTAVISKIINPINNDVITDN